MARRAVIPATVASSSTPDATPLVHDSYPAGPSASHSTERRISYGALTTQSAASQHLTDDEEDGVDEDDDQLGGLEAEYEVDDGQRLIYDFTWRYMSRLYLLVPAITTLWILLLILLVTFAWPPNEAERRGGQAYPHPFLWRSFLIGIFASFTTQTLRVPAWIAVSWSGLSINSLTFTSTTLHTLLHELIRLSSLPLLIPSPVSGFHSSYYLGLGWGVAESAWGIVQGWEQMSLYEDVMKPEEGKVLLKGESLVDHDIARNHEGTGEDFDEAVLIQNIHEVELERRVEILERLRGRRDLEEVVGVPFPSIPFPLHLLWRLDTLLLNLGLTLLLSAYYFNSAPIYGHPQNQNRLASHLEPAAPAGNKPSPYLPLAWALIAALHVGVSLVWKVVGRVGVGAVTWGGLIVALGSVFAGLGAWGGLV